MVFVITCVLSDLESPRERRQREFLSNARDSISHMSQGAMFNMHNHAYILKIVTAYDMIVVSSSAKRKAINQPGWWCSYN